MPVNDKLGVVPAFNSAAYTIPELLKDPKRIERVIEPTPDVWLSTFLFRPDRTDSGTAVFNQARKNGAYPDKGSVEEIAPGAEFPKIDIAGEIPQTAVATKQGFALEVKDESTQRKNYDEVGRGLRLGTNLMNQQDAYQLYKAFVDAQVPTQNAVAAWNTANVDPRRDVRTAQAKIRNTKLGYQPRTVLINPDALMELELNEKFASWMPRENPNLNPFLNEGLHGFLNVEWVENEFVPEDEVIVLQRNITGAAVVERDTEVEPIRQSGQKTLYEVSRRGMPIITDPLSAVIIKGVLS